MPRPIDQVDTILVSVPDDGPKLRLEFSLLGSSETIFADLKWVKDASGWTMRRQLLSKINSELLDIRILLRVEGDEAQLSDTAPLPDPKISTSQPPAAAKTDAGYAWRRDGSHAGQTFMLFGQAHYRGAVHEVYATSTPAEFNIAFLNGAEFLARGTLTFTSGLWKGPVRV